MEQVVPIDGLVSVIVPTYNRYELLNHCIKSILANTYKNVEVIIINDCSTDQRYYSGDLEKYEKTTVIHLPINMCLKHNVTSAQGLTRNYGLEKARGEWIAFLDDDDFYLENKIEYQLSCMKCDNFLFSSSEMFLINHNSISLDKLDFNITDHYENSVKRILNFDIISKSNYIANSSVMIHHTIIEKTGKFDICPREEDWDYWKRALKYTDCLFINKPLIYYTRTVNNKTPIKYYS
jgi:glycosyltransferase involved in cell wall biosynthesis